MFSKYVTRLFRIKEYHTKHKFSNLPRLSDVHVNNAVGKRIKVQGWVFGVRKMKTILFLELSDGSTNEMLQVLVNRSDVVDKIAYGCSITADGELDKAPNGRLELRASNISLIGSCDLDGYPFPPKIDFPAEYVRQNLHMRVRRKDFSAVLRIRDITCTAISTHFRNRGFINIHTPLLTSNICEDAGEVFSVKPSSTDLLKLMKKENYSDQQTFFDSDVFLSVSGQLHLEAMARALSKVYTIGPSFRAENSKSRLHLSEFYMVEAEIAFIDQIEYLMEEIELLLKNITKKILIEGCADIKYLKCSEPLWLNQKFGCITYDEAEKILQKNTDKITKPIKYGQALSKEHELFLVEHNNGVPIFIINWPKQTKPFYMKKCEDDSSKVAALDLLFPVVGELVGGGLREDNYETLKSVLPESSKLSWYLDLRKYGNVQTGGFGMGFERYLQSLLNIPNIKDTIPFPRWPHNCFA